MSEHEDAEAYRLTQAERLLTAFVPIKALSDQISQHEIRVYEAVRQNAGWLTAREIAAKADVANRTARAHVAAMTEAGVFDVAKAFGGYRYRIKTEMEAPGVAYVGRLEAAKRVFG